MPRELEFATRLFLHWLNQRYKRAFKLDKTTGPVWFASDGSLRLAIVAAPISEADEAWQQRKVALEHRLDQARPGAYLLWLPPGADLPGPEPEESDWVRRAVLGASRLASGRSGEIRLPAVLSLGKVRDEGGYVSVTGGLARYWTTIAEGLQGSFFLNSTAIKRFTRNEEERLELYQNIGLTSQGLKTGDVVEFEHEDAWSLQRLPRSEATEGMNEGWAIAGCPPSFDINDGAAVRRNLRRLLREASETLAPIKDAARAVVLIGAYDYLENETAGPAMRGFDPALTLPFDMIGLIADAEIKPLLMNKSLRLIEETDGF